MDIDKILFCTRSSNSETRLNAEKALNSIVFDVEQICSFFNYIVDTNYDINNKKLFFVFIKNYISNYMVSTIIT